MHPMLWSTSPGPDLSPTKRPLRSAIAGRGASPRGSPQGGGSSGGTGDAAEYYPAGPGLWDHAPSFACGALTALVLQWLVRSLWSGLRGAELGCIELRHMAEALHAEVDAARGLLAECRSERRLGVATPAVPPAQQPSGPPSHPPTAIGTTAALATAATPAEPIVAYLVDISAANDGPTTLSAPSTTMEAFVPGGSPEVAALTAAQRGDAPSPGGRTWMASASFAGSLGLLLLDTGLVYFCVAHALTPEARIALEARAARALACWRRARDPDTYRLEAKSASQSPASDGAVPLPPLTPIDPSGGAIMGSRPERRRARPALRRKDPDLGLKQRLATVALGAACFLGVLAQRACSQAASAAGLRFLEHLLTYAAVTVRVCLVALLVLF